MVSKVYKIVDGKRVFDRFLKPVGAPSKPSAALKTAVAKVLKSKTETKYVGEDIASGVAITAGVTTPAGLQRILPRLTQGTAENQRVGDLVSPVKARSFITYYLSNTPNMFDVTINCVILMVKGAANAAAVAAGTGGDLLKTGNVGNVDPNNPNQTIMLTLVNQYPINTEQYTLLKWYKRRFCKGSGAINGAPGGGVEAGQIANTPSAHTFKFTWTPPRLKYDGVASQLPTNHYPVLITWATAHDGSALQATILNYSIRSDLFYKDS